MKVWKKTWVAVLVVLVLIAAAVGIGQLRRPQQQVAGGKTDLDTTLDTAYLSKYLSDGADLFSDGEEKSILLYNANWDARYNSIVAVVTLTESGDDSLYDTALDWANRWQLGAGDAILVLETAGSGDYYFLTGDDFYSMMPDDVVSRYLDQYLEADFAAGRYGKGVLNLFSAVNELYYDTFGLGNEGYSGYSAAGYHTPARWLTILVVLVVAVLLAASVADHYRYDTYRRRYGGMGTPPVVFRPILFWHRPGWGWYERRWHSPPPPRGPRGPGPGSGPRPGGPRPGGGNPGGFGGMGGFGRGGGFGGGHGGGRSGAGRGGSFGGGHGGGRGGGFGGGRGGGFGGGRR